MVMVATIGTKALRGGPISDIDVWAKWCLFGKSFQAKCSSVAYSPYYNYSIYTMNSPLTDSPSSNQSLYNILHTVTVSLTHGNSAF